MDVLEEYRKAAAERQVLGIPPLPLSVVEVQEVIERLSSGSDNERQELLYLLRERVNPGVDAGARVKAEVLGRIVAGEITGVGIEPVAAVAWLGEMRGGTILRLCLRRWTINGPRWQRRQFQVWKILC
jgi:aconitate hydratase 2/2-methylisocitrate dehydratase